MRQRKSQLNYGTAKRDDSLLLESFSTDYHFDYLRKLKRVQMKFKLVSSERK